MAHVGRFHCYRQYVGNLSETMGSQLRDRYPIAPYVHMTDLVTGNDPFERKGGWTSCKVNDLVADVLALFRELTSWGELCAFACAVDVDARERLYNEGYDVSRTSRNMCRDRDRKFN